jgi:hypothetical protein
MQSVVCEECQGEARLVTSVAAFGTASGARFYQCRDCRHLQVQEFTGRVPPLPYEGFGRDRA